MGNLNLGRPVVEITIEIIIETRVVERRARLVPKTASLASSEMELEGYFTRMSASAIQAAFCLNNLLVSRTEQLRRSDHLIRSGERLSRA